MVISDFKGFYFNGHHSSDFHIIRVSTSKRYNENLTNGLNDKTVDIPTRDGKYYFSTTYKEKTFTINYAFDSMTEIDLHNLKQWLNGKDIGLLIFDELPYKAYTAKVSGTSQIKYLCFDDRNNDRVYKGEGTITFICYYPYARTLENINTVFNPTSITSADGKNLNSYNTEIFTNKGEWSAASRLTENYNIVNGYLNLGDVPTPFIFTLDLSDTITLENHDEIQVFLTGTSDKKIGSIKLKLSATLNNGKIEWNSKTGIIKHNSVLIRYIGDGLMELPVTNTQYGIIFKHIHNNVATIITPTLKYDYLYY